MFIYNIYLFNIKKVYKYAKKINYIICAYIKYLTRNHKIFSEGDL